MSRFVTYLELNRVFSICVLAFHFSPYLLPSFQIYENQLSPLPLLPLRFLSLNPTFLPLPSFRSTSFPAFLPNCFPPILMRTCFLLYLSYPLPSLHPTFLPPNPVRLHQRADLPTVTDSPYLLHFGSSKYSVTAVLQIIRQRAVSVKTNYYIITQQTAPLADA